MFCAAASPALNAEEIFPEDAEFMIRTLAAKYSDLDYGARVGIIAVIKNRVMSPDYPDTATGVILSYREEDGRLRFSGKESVSSGESYEMTANAYGAVALGADPTGGALDFQVFNVPEAKFDWRFDDSREDRLRREAAKTAAEYSVVIGGIGFR